MILIPRMLSCRAHTSARASATQFMWLWVYTRRGMADQRWTPIFGQFGG